MSFVETNTIHAILQRLKERKLVQWAFAYLAGGWVALQVLGFVADSFAWPPFVIRSLIVGLVAGLPIVLVLAWYHGEKGRQRVSGAELLILTALLAIAAVALALFGTRNSQMLSAEVFAGQPGAVRALLAADDRPSLAVLPFLNRSRPEDQYFTDGMHDEILTRISRINGLRTVPRTSVAAYRASNASILDIGAELAVRYLLQGSVQRADNRVRVSVQLVDAVTEDHLWSNEFTEGSTVQDLFDIQTRVTEEVARELRLVLVGEEERRLLESATASTEAYDWYLRALVQWRQGPELGAIPTPELLEEQLEFIGRALAADPQFARAHAHAGLVHVNAYYWGYDTSPERAVRARDALDRADQIAPGDPETAWARAEYLYSVERDATVALEFLGPLESVLGQDEDLFTWMGLFERTRGEWEASVENFRAGIRVNPRNASLWEKAGVSLMFLRRFDEAEEALRTALELAPPLSIAEYFVNQIPVQRDGDVSSLRSWAASTEQSAGLFSAVGGAFLDEDWDALTNLLNQAESDIPYEGPLVLVVRPLWHARMLRAQGNVAASGNHAQAAMMILESELDRRGEDRRFLRHLAIAYALLNNAEAADRAMERALEILPLDRDAQESAWVRPMIVAMDAYLGRVDKTLEGLDELLTEPAFFGTVPIVELDPTYRELREDPRFQELLDRHRRGSQRF